MSTKKYLDDSGLAYFWGKLKSFFAKGNGKIFYGTCDTSGATAAKVVTCSAFTSADLENGTMLIVKFANANSATAADVTLNVNSTGAMDVKMVSDGNAGTLPSAGQIRPISTAFIFNKSSDGVTKYWLLISSDTDTTYATITTTELNTGTGTGKRVVSASFLRNNFYTESEVDAFFTNRPTIVHLTDESDMPATPDANTIYMIDE